jgi:DNA polymerase I
MLENHFLEIWLVNFTSSRPPGEVPQPLGLVARELRSGRLVHLQQGNLSSETPPYLLGSDSLFVTFDAPTALGCHLSLGWPLPARVLDLHAEFRCLTAGLLPPGDYDLFAALAHYGLGGEGVEGLGKLLDATLPSISLPHALLRGRYTAAVSRMEAVGVPIDVPALNLLRAGWETVQDGLIERVDKDYGVYNARKFNPIRWRAWLNRNGISWPRLAPGRLDLSLETFRDMALAHPEVRAMKELRATLAVLKPAELPCPSGQSHD